MTTVFTNGVFDIIHAGHIRLLEYAASLGDQLIVGINSDASVRRLKGPTRPINDVYSRVKVLTSLRCVNQVITFSEDTPERLIKDISPHILVKGPEAVNAPIPGADFVKSYGGLVIIPILPVRESTTKIIEKVLCDQDQPLPVCCIIKADLPSDNLSIRFVKFPDGIRPVLYNNGKRVTTEWSIKLVHNQPVDKCGSSG